MFVTLCFFNAEKNISPGAKQREWGKELGPHLLFYPLGLCLSRQALSITTNYLRFNNNENRQVLRTFSSVKM
jgi:hypothetical protein